MKHKVSAVVAVALLAASAAVAVWIVFARSDAPGADAPGARVPSASATTAPTAAPTPSFHVPATKVNPLKGSSYCATAKLLGIFAHQPYGLSPGLGVVEGRTFGRRLEVVAATYRRLAAQAERQPKVGADAARSWSRLAAVVSAAEQKLRVTGYDAQSQVMIVELAKVAKATQTHLTRATATLTDACGVTREAIGL